MAKKTAKSTKKAKPKQGSSLSEDDIRWVVESVMAELAERPRWTMGCFPPMNVAKHVVRKDEALLLLDYFIKVATSTRQAIDRSKGDEGWMQGC